MTRTQRLLRWLTPYRELQSNERRRTATLRYALAERDATISDLRIDLAVERAWTGVANEQRRRARDLAAGLVADLPAEAWDDTDTAILGAWLNGERPA